MAKKEKKSVVGLRPTTSYSPLRGQNQDYGGVGVKNDNADYTISDEHIHKIDPWTPAHAPEWEKESPATRKALASKLTKDTDPNRGTKMKKSLREVAEGRSLKEIREMIGLVSEGDDSMVKNLKPINLTGGSQERTDRLAAMAGGKSATPASMDKKQSARDFMKMDEAKDDDDEEEKDDDKDDDKDSKPSKGSPSADQYKKMSRSDQVGARMQHDMDHGLVPKGGAAVGDDEVDDMHKREYDSKMASGHGHLINPKNPYNTPGYTGPKDSYGKSKADWDKESKERRDHIEKHGMDSFNKKYGYLPGSPRHQKVDDQSAELERKINTHNMLKAAGMKSPYDDTPAVKESRIDEISKNLAVRYNMKVVPTLNKNQPSGKDAMRKRENREAGVKLSYNKYHDYKVKVPATEEVEYVEEARGRPKKDAASDSPDIHPIQQARQVISTRGMHPFTFANGKRAQMNPMTAHRILAHHDNLQTPSEKEAFASRIHKDVDSLHSWLAGKPHDEELPKISLGGSSKVGGIGDRSRPSISGVKPGRK